MKKILLLVTICFVLVQTYMAQTVTKYITVDQFGYRPSAQKVAVIKDAIVGYDDTASFNPGTTYHLMDASTDLSVFSATPTAWNSGATDASSGDKAWWFDFSSYTTDGTYYIWDEQNNVISYEFEINDMVYEDVLKHAIRTFYYQRAGHSKSLPYAEAGWVDGIDHQGSLQDSECRIYNDPNNASTEKDLSGGWYDAGDYNKYTPWTANYVYKMLLSYDEHPDAFGDNYDLPESGNGIPDIVDEAKWGMDHLLKLVQTDGSVISIVDLDHASPPSSATGPSLYGDPNTHSANTTAAAMALGSMIFEDLGMTTYATTLRTKAELVWDWSVANPNVEWRNNDGAYGSQGIGSGQQETDQYGRDVTKIKAAVALYELTGESEYKTYVENNYTDVNLIQWSYAFPYQSENQDMLLRYASLPGVTAAVANDIETRYVNSIKNSGPNLPAVTGELDPYRAHLDSYTWGSNNTKSRHGGMYYNIKTFGLDGSIEDQCIDAAEDYLHYIHGTNPLSLVYLSNMYNYGAENCVNEFYHTWFSNGSANWDRVGTSTYGPAPGFLTGGPNPSYDYDGCCPGGCGSAGNNAMCSSEWIPTGQPDQKSYKDFNTNWPLNSWEVTENSCGYQLSYIQLLSKFVTLPTDCNGDLNGTAYLDGCSDCVGGNTGLSPCVVAIDPNEKKDDIVISPNPFNQSFVIKSETEVNWVIQDTFGKQIFSGSDTSVNLVNMPSGIYYIQFDNGVTRRIIKI